MRMAAQHLTIALTRTVRATPPARRQSFPLDAVTLDRSLDTPLHRQLYNGLRRMIEERSLAAGSSLPSSRLLAGDLGIARNTVISAYEQLTTEGYVVSKQGARPVVVDLPTPPALSPAALNGETRHAISSRGKLMMEQPSQHGAPGHLSFHPGMPDAENFPFNTWSRLLARRAKAARYDLFGTYNVTGHPALREAIATYVKAARRVRCSPDQIVVTTGAQAGLDLMARLLLDPGETAWVEEPGYYGAQAAFVASGARLSPLFVDSQGWVLDPPAGSPPRVIYVTPSCHHPLGATMRMEQRLRLLEIAERLDAWIIEDDFDGEYRFQGQPIPAMQGTDHSDRVIYCGTFAKILFPALRLGFMVLPPSLQARIGQALSITGQFAPLLLQAALADFIDQGHMSRHLRRMRRIYAGRRQAFRRLAGEYLGDWMTLRSSEAGMQMVGMMREGWDDRAVAAAARRRGIIVSPLSIHYRHAAPQAGLVMGYAATDEAAMPQGFRILRAAFREVGGG
jgi:GntR family transcriptional regulator/MocR family aminotransferase